MRRLSNVTKGITLLPEVPHFSSSAFFFLDIVYTIRRRKSEGSEKFLSLCLHWEQNSQHKCPQWNAHLCTHTGPCTTIPLCRFWEQQLHIWKFLESLGSHSNVAAACLQLSGRGHSHPLHRAQPDEGHALYLSRIAESLSALPWFAVRVTDLRTAPVLRLTFSVMRLRICSRSCRMLRGMMNRNGGHRRSPLRKTLKIKISSQFYGPCTMIQ